MATPLAKAGNLQESSGATEQENNNLKFCLMDLDAPSRKIIESLTEKITIASRKVIHVKRELQRHQEMNCSDSIMCELNGQSSSTSQQQEDKGKAEPDFSLGSTAVAQIMVMELEHKMYQMEKDKKKQEQHMDHYHVRAREWKEKALKEKAGQKA